MPIVGAVGSALSGGGKNAGNFASGANNGGQMGPPSFPEPPPSAMGSDMGGWASGQVNRGLNGPMGPPTMAPNSGGVTGPLPGLGGNQGGASGPLPGLGGPNYSQPQTFQAAQAAQQWAEFMAAPQMQQLQNQTLTAWAQANLGMGGYDAQRRYMLGDYNSDMQRNALAMQGLGLDRQDLGTNRSRVGLDINGRQVDRGYIGEMQGLADRSLANQIGTIDQNLGADIRNRNSDYTGRGAWFAPFRGIENRESQTAAERERDMARISRSERESGWQRDLRHLDIGDQRSQLDYQDLGSAESRLDLEAQNLGLNRDDLERGLQQGLEALGLSQNMTVIDLFSMLNSTDAQQQQLASQIMSDAYAQYMLYSNNPAAMMPLGNGYATQQGRTP